MEGLYWEKNIVRLEKWNLSWTEWKFVCIEWKDLLHSRQKKKKKRKKEKPLHLSTSGIIFKLPRIGSEKSCRHHQKVTSCLWEHERASWLQTSTLYHQMPGNNGEFWGEKLWLWNLVNILHVKITKSIFSYDKHAGDKPSMYYCYKLYCSLQSLVKKIFLA